MTLTAVPEPEPNEDDGKPATPNKKKTTRKRVTQDAPGSLHVLDPQAVYSDMAKHIGTAEELYCVECGEVLGSSLVTPPLLHETTTGSKAMIQAPRHHIPEAEAVVSSWLHNMKTGHARTTTRAVYVVTPL